MDPFTILAAANASLALVKALIPEIQRLTKTGEISVEEQFKTLHAYNELKNNLEEYFSGEEWRLETGVSSSSSSSSSSWPPPPSPKPPPKKPPMPSSSSSR